MMVLLAAACVSPPPLDPGAYADALAEVSDDPQRGQAACRALTTERERVDCLAAAADALAHTDPTAAAAVCATLPWGLWRDECGFQVAERSADPGRCAEAGRFELDCRMHLFSRDLFERLPPDPTPAALEGQLAEAVATAGFAPHDDRPWVAAWRLVAARMHPLDRASCDDLSAARVATCRATLRDHYGDLLNYARDTATFPCDGGPLAGRLDYVRPDPELDALVAARRQEDLCP